MPRPVETGRGIGAAIEIKLAHVRAGAVDGDELVVGWHTPPAKIKKVRRFETLAKHHKRWLPVTAIHELGTCRIARGASS